MLTRMRGFSLGVLILMAVVGLAVAQSPCGPFTFERIQNSNREPQNWLTYSGNNMGQRYRLLSQITPQNAKDLEMAWLWQARSVEKFEATSIVVDGILYTVQAPNDVVALDAKTGRPIWTYQYRNLPEARTNSPGTCETRSQQGTANDLILATPDDVVDIGASLYQSEDGLTDRLLIGLACRA